MLEGARTRGVPLAVARDGSSSSEIAGALYISEKTVKTHVSSILGKLGLASRTQAALYALKTGRITLDEIELGQPS